MSNIALTVKHLQSKVEKLVHLHKKLETEHVVLKEKHYEVNKKLSEQKNIINQLEEKNKILKLSKKLSETNEGASDARSKINELVREIDKCIALLNE